MEQCTNNRVTFTNTLNDNSDLGLNGANRGSGHYQSEDAGGVIVIVLVLQVLKAKVLSLDVNAEFTKSR